MKSIRLDNYDTALFLERVGAKTLYDINEYDPVQENRFELEVSFLNDKFEYLPFYNYALDVRVYNHHLKLDSEGFLTISKLKAEYDESTEDTLL